MAETQNRKHSKVTKLPKEVRETVNELLVAGKTIAQILDHLKALAKNGTIAEEDLPSKSGVGRYSQGFLKKLEEMELMKEQAKAIVTKMGNDGLVMEESAANLVLNSINKLLMKPNLKAKEIFFHAMSVAKVQASSASRERAKIEVRKDMEKRAKSAAKAIDHMAKKKGRGLSPELVAEIKAEILGIAS